MSTPTCITNASLKLLPVFAPIIFTYFLTRRICQSGLAGSILSRLFEFYLASHGTVYFVPGAPCSQLNERAEGEPLIVKYDTGKLAEVFGI